MRNFSHGAYYALGTRQILLLSFYGEALGKTSFLICAP